MDADRDRVLFVRASASADRKRRPYVAVRTDGGPPAILSSASEAALTGHASRPESVLGKIVHIDEGGESIDSANCGLRSGAPFVVVTAEIEKLQDPRAALV